MRRLYRVSVTRSGKPRKCEVPSKHAYLCDVVLDHHGDAAVGDGLEQPVAESQTRRR
jgi:hypothetical protein